MAEEIAYTHGVIFLHIAAIVYYINTLDCLGSQIQIRYIDPTRLFWVYTIILISNTGNLHVYSERTVIRNTRVEILKVN